MSDFCYYCNGTGERDFISGVPCYECGGTGWTEDEEMTDEERDFWDAYYEEQELRDMQ